MHRECRERFPRYRGSAIPTCNTARAWDTCRDVCRDRQLAVSLQVGGGENVPGIPGACANRICTYLVWGPYHNNSHISFSLFSHYVNSLKKNCQFSRHSVKLSLQMILLVEETSACHSLRSFKALVLLSNTWENIICECICSNGGAEKVPLDWGGQCPLYQWNLNQHCLHCEQSSVDRYTSWECGVSSWWTMCCAVKTPLGIAQQNGWLRDHLTNQIRWGFGDIDCTPSPLRITLFCCRSW